MKRILISAIFIVILLSGCNTQSTEKKLMLHEGDHILDLPYENVSESEIEALNLAINDEYKAKAIYQKVIDKFGDVKPFSNIINSEEEHIAELTSIYEKYDLDIPEDNLYDQVPEFASIAEACEGAVQAEIENANLYDSLFSKVDNQDITSVFTSLRDASRNNHLPAFQRCTER